MGEVCHCVYVGCSWLITMDIGRWWLKVALAIVGWILSLRVMSSPMTHPVDRRRRQVFGL